VEDDPNILSKAITLYFGYGLSPFPRVDRDRLMQVFGGVQGAALESRVVPLHREIDTIDVDWTKHSLESGTGLAVAEMRRRHPELPEEALQAFGWYFSWRWR
jgi:hypothetical protein